MADLNFSDFEISLCHASIFTRKFNFSVRKVLTDFYFKVANEFDDEPYIVSPSPLGIPDEIPRMAFRSSSKIWQFEIASGRVNLIWEKNAPEIRIQKEDFFKRAIELFETYITIFSPQIGRLGAILHRFAKHQTPGLLLARHFCDPEHIQGALNRTENFDLNAHKHYTLKNEFHVNSWARNRTGRVKSEPVVIFEQNLNTLFAEIDSQEFDMEDLKTFFDFASNESDAILKSYYPAG